MKQTRRKPANWQSFDVPSRMELRQFIVTDTPVDNELMTELWDTSTGAPGLLQAHRPGTVGPARPRGQRDYEYDPTDRVFRRSDTGRPVTKREMRTYVSRLANAASNRMRTETQQLLAGAILFSVWYFRMRSLMKALYRAVWIVWLGGELFYDDAERNLFYLFTLIYFESLDRMAHDIDSGAQPFDGRAVARAGAMGRRANSMHQNLFLERGKREGYFTHGRRVLGPNENHCHDSKYLPGCVELAELGWVPISEVVPLGDATCDGYCYCTIELTRRSENE